MLFRSLATHGATDHTMTHPFWVNRDIAMIHNGVLQIETKGTNSDTAQYVEDILSPMAKRDGQFFRRSHIMKLGSQAIKGSKFCFLRRCGAWAIWNASDGHWDEGVWYSNQGYKRTYIRWPSRAGKAIGLSHSAFLYGETKGALWDGDDDLTKDTPPARPSVLDVASGSATYAGLRRDHQWMYDDLLDAGFTMTELDDIIQTSGECELDKLADIHINGGGS